MPAKPKATKGEKVNCDVCNKPFVVGYIATHKRRQHGVYGGRSGRVHHRTRTNGTQPKPTFAGFKAVEGMIILQDNEGGMWLAEKIR